MTEKVAEFYYRYEDGSIDFAWLNPEPVKSTAILFEYKVLKHTPQGVWIEYVGNIYGKKFVLNDSHKQWACPTIAKAQASYQRRKAKQVEILRNQLSRAEAFANDAILSFEPFTDPFEGFDNTDGEIS